jgi:hypothetical protein
MHERACYSITDKGRAVLRGPVARALSGHSRDLLALCDPRVTVAQARQFLPPESLQAALYSLRELELIEGPPIDYPRTSKLQDLFTTFPAKSRAVTSAV